MDNKETRDAREDRLVNLMLRVVEDNRLGREDIRRVYERVGESVTVHENIRAELEASNKRFTRIEADISHVYERVGESVTKSEDVTIALETTNAQAKRIGLALHNLEKHVGEIEAELAAFLPQIQVVVKIAAESANKAAAEIVAGRAEASAAAAARDKTDQFILAQSGSPKGVWTHFLDRLDNIKTRTWLFVILLLTVGMFTAFTLYMLDVGLKRQQEAPHVRDHVAAPASTSPGEPKSDRNAK